MLDQRSKFGNLLPIEFHAFPNTGPDLYKNDVDILLISDPKISDLICLHWYRIMVWINFISANVDTQC